MSWLEKWRSRESGREMIPPQQGEDGIPRAVEEDIPLDELAAVRESVLPILVAERAHADRIREIGREYRENEPTPTFLTYFFQRLWRVREEGLKEELLSTPLAPVWPCTYTEERVRELESEGRRIGYMPPELAIQANRHILAAMFPDMIVQGGDISTYTNESSPVGWFDYDAEREISNIRASEASQRRVFQHQHRHGMNLNQYIVAGQDTKLLTGKYLEQERNWNRLHGSKSAGNTISARFTPGGSLIVRTLFPSADHRVGSRSVGVK